MCCCFCSYFYFYKKLRCLNFANGNGQDGVCVSECPAFETHLFVTSICPKKCRSSCRRMRGWPRCFWPRLPSSLVEALSPEDRAERGNYSLQALVGKPPLVIWSMQNISLSHVALGLLIFWTPGFGINGVLCTWVLQYYFTNGWRS